jgi:energy-coupling factor transporter ATP-binding protein EcfA2
MPKSSAQKALDILSTWTALEVLSPQEFKKEAYSKNLAILSSNSSLPWATEANPPAGKKYFYQIIVGTINLAKAQHAILQKYSDQNLEKKSSKEESIIAVISIDQEGYLAADKISVTISGLAWGLPTALKGNLKNLANWSKIEIDLVEKFDEFLRRYSENADRISVNYALIKEAYEYLIDVLQLPRELTNDKFYAIKSEEKSDKKEPSNSIILNSFYLKDLAKAANFFVTNNNLDHIPKNLKLYLGLEKPSEKFNILKDNSVLKKAVSPKLMPQACWPASNHNPLILLQQAAVNLSLSKLEDGGILAVNGPPGTGKTTLLRDIIAGIVVKRAEAMCAFDNPSSAFIGSGEKFAAGRGGFELNKLDERLKGFEILIASSNNNAVQNVSAELPNLNAIAADADDLRYFKSLSDKLIGTESWGMISAVLGNSENCRNFSKTFWWDEDCSFQNYLAKACDRNKVFTKKDLTTGQDVAYTPQIILENSPPKNKNEALDNWREARENFQNTLTEINTKLAELEEIADFFREIDLLENDFNDLAKLEASLKKHQKLRPSFLYWILAPFWSWRRKNIELLKIKPKLIKAEEYRKKLGSHIVEEKLFNQSRRTLHLISPWCDEETKLLREKLFTQAMKLHKCFIDVAAKPLRHNLGILMMQLSNSQNSSAAEDFASDLWSSLFLVIPAVSTAFASVGRMLEKLPPESLGWLLIDEAGQAAPQQAVGAILKTKRAIVVGDPMQIEPVVTLSESLTQNICKEFEVEANVFNAPEASVQTLCDVATPYFAELNGCSVGVPLLVHRRCDDPMFSIANSIAYEGLMVNAKKSRASIIKDFLGSSTWFDVESFSEQKWSPAEGEKLMEILAKINAGAEGPDLFIITPFRNVKYELKNLVRQSGILQRWQLNDSAQQKWIQDRIGTVHTFQGKEAEAVILVLGAPSFEQSGSRIWAGKKPNLLNVAVTRAKEVFYVIGNKKLWCKAGVFGEMADRI